VRKCAFSARFEVAVEPLLAQRDELLDLGRHQCVEAYERVGRTIFDHDPVLSEHSADHVVGDGADPPGFVQYADEWKIDPPDLHLHDHERPTGTTIPATTGVDSWGASTATIGLGGT